MKNRRGLPSFPGSKSVYISLGFITILEALAVIAQAVFIARAVTFLFEGKQVTELVNDVILFFVAFLLRYIFSYLRQLIAERFAERIGKDLRKKLLKSYFDQGQSFVQIHGTGKLVTLALEGIKQVKTYIELALPKVLRSLILPSLIVIYIFTLDRPSAYILVGVIPVVIIFMILLGLAAQKMADRQYESYRVLSNHFIDSLKGMETLAYLGKSKDHGKRISSVSRDYRQATNKTLRYAFLSSFALDFFTSLAIAFVAVGLGFRLIEGVLPLLPALTILILAPEYFLPIRQVGQDYHATLDGQVALREIEEVTKQKGRKIKSPLQAIPLQAKELELELDNLSVDRDGRTILKNLSAKIEGPRFIGVIGPSGAGKSTLIHLLAGFLDPANQEPALLLNGERTETLNQRIWLESMTYIPQHPYIFPVSLLDNIRFYEPEASLAEVEKVIEKIGLNSLVNSFPKGIHEEIGEGGRSLSGGQEQRIALARALLSDRPILLLDEPTAHLDIETEYELKQVMKDLFKDKLVIFATHRTHWMKDMDQLLILEKGEILEQGRPEDLAKTSTRFNHFIEKMKAGGEAQ